MRKWNLSPWVMFVGDDNPIEYKGWFLSMNRVAARYGEVYSDGYANYLAVL